MFGVILAAALTVLPSPGQSSALPLAGSVPPAPEQVMSLPDELRESFRRQVLKNTHSPNQQLEKLVKFMFDKEGLGLEYQADATNTIAETYRTRKANCLAFTMLTVVLAREAGLDVYAQQIDRVLAWDRMGGVVLQNMHANAGVTINGTQYVVDVASSVIKTASVRHRIDDGQLLALYYNNRAMELMVAGRYADAGKWLDVALSHSPGEAAFWNNAGVLDLRQGNAGNAESLFLKALEKDPRLTSAVSNLIVLYRIKGDADRAAQWQKRADRIMRKDPFYQFSLAQQKEEAGDFSEAVRLYRRAIALNRDEDAFHFGLARTYFRMGQRHLADVELERAYELSAGQDRSRYASKLDALRRTKY